ncbi:Threonine--tRNA ligase [Nymphaea thermarum]|nr:Threonine--tRNA ligase [Nymphaea thermarum]
MTIKSRHLQNIGITGTEIFPGSQQEASANSNHTSGHEDDDAPQENAVNSFCSAVPATSDGRMASSRSAIFLSVQSVFPHQARSFPELPKPLLSAVTCFGVSSSCLLSSSSRLCIRRRAQASRELRRASIPSSSLAIAEDVPSQPGEESAGATDRNSLASVVLPTNEESSNLLRVRHTCAHVMAMAVQKLFPNAKVTIGPWIDHGFYYDFDMEPLTDKDLKKIKKEMVGRDRIIRRDLPLIREEVSRMEAQRRIEAIGEPYKLDILESIKTDPITIYHIGNEWWDLCAGPHVESTGHIDKNAVMLESVAGAYWRGDESNAMLQRIYGTAWENEEQLKAYLYLKEEAKRRDHRRLGQELDLFSIQEDAGGGLVFWHPKGAIVRHIIEDSWKKLHMQDGYELLYTPHVAKADLWKISGHLEFYKENMYDQIKIEDELYQLRPMNCPYHILVYKRKLHSYRDFPIRVAELGTVYRYELSGTLHGLFRVRGFTQGCGCATRASTVELFGVFMKFLPPPLLFPLLPWSGAAVALTSVGSTAAAAAAVAGFSAATASRAVFSAVASPSPALPSP